MHLDIPHQPSLLVRQAQQGDVGAFEALYRDNIDRIYTLCRRMSADATCAEELTQESFVRAWQRLGSFRGDSAFSSWLYRLAVNVVLGDKRSQVRRLARVQKVALNVDSPSDHPSRQEATFDLERAIDSLPPKARQVFVLHDVEGFRHQEIADLMGSTVGTSKAQLHRARQLLREALEK